MLVLTANGWPASAGAEVPNGPIGYVTDLAMVIEPEMERRIADLSGELERKTGVRVVVLTLNHLGGFEIEHFTQELLWHWLPDPRERGRTVLLVDAIEEKKIRLEIGSGLDNLITRETAWRVEKQVIVPSLRGGDKGMTYLLTVTELADAIARAKGITLYRLLGPGFLKGLPTVAGTESGSDKFWWVGLACFGPAFLVMAWYGIRLVREGGLGPRLSQPPPGALSPPTSVDCLDGFDIFGDGGGDCSF